MARQADPTAANYGSDLPYGGGRSEREGSRLDSRKRPSDQGSNQRDGDSLNNSSVFRDFYLDKEK